ncbi:hypothetical protein [Promicromonospora iranensis]|uniref:Uncharacterized protein n=1 Tax=Promicromonospora iranensis TaxID=1105144 RepID=A0ABU2CUU0_9MICO|nr:hypothetical protein [Promicromonospora iranensis]MDR7385102.1 hypothetical protein [Promicromonospora iranensis]
MTDQPGYDPAEDPDADPDQLNPRTGAAAGMGDTAATQTVGDEPDADADPESLNPRTGDHAHPEE